MASQIKKLGHSIQNVYDNEKRNYLWFKKNNINKPWSRFQVRLRGQQYELDSWHKFQKATLKDLFIKAFQEEQDAALVDRKANLQLDLTNAGRPQKEIDKELKKLKKPSFDKTNSRVSHARFLDTVYERLEYEKIETARDGAYDGVDTLGQKLHLFSHKVAFIRLGKVIRLFDLEFFDPSKVVAGATISWPEFKTKVFYPHFNETKSFVAAAQQEKRILKVIDQAWSQLLSERKHKTDAVTYDQLKQKLQAFTHTFDEGFFTRDFWLAKGGDPVTSINDFKRIDCDMKLTLGDTYAIIRDLKNEHHVEASKSDVQMGIDALDEDDDDEQEGGVGEEEENPLDAAGDVEEEEGTDPPSPVSLKRSISRRLSRTFSRVKGFFGDGDVNKDGSDETTIKVAGAPEVANTAAPIAIAPDLNPIPQLESAVQTIAQQDVAALEQAVVQNATTELTTLASNLNGQLTCGLVNLTQLATEEAKTILANAQQALGVAEQKSVIFIQSVLLKIQNAIDQVWEDMELKLKTLTSEAKSKTSGLSAILSKEQTITDRKRDYDAKIASASSLKSSFEQDGDLIMESIRSLFRKSLALVRTTTDVPHMAEDHGAWKEAVQEGDDESEVVSKSATTSASAPASNLAGTSKCKVFQLPCTLENNDAFVKKHKVVEWCFKSKDLKRDCKDLPDCVNYGCEFPPCDAQEQNHPGCIDAVCLLKQWQEFKNYGLQENLSQDYLCKTLNANHTLGNKAVNMTVDVTIWDVLGLCRKRGIPTEAQYKTFCDRSSSKTAQRIREHAARFKVQCRMHMFDRILLVKDMLHVQLALSKYGPLLCSLPVYRPDKTKFWECASVEETDTCTPLGHHTGLLIGYDTHSQTFLLRNTVGPQYGDYGCVHIPFKSFVKYHLKAILCLDQTRPNHAGACNGSQHPDEEHISTWTPIPEMRKEDVLLETCPVQTSPSTMASSPINCVSPSVEELLNMKLLQYKEKCRAKMAGFKDPDDVEMGVGASNDASNDGKCDIKDEAVGDANTTARAFTTLPVLVKDSLMLDAERKATGYLNTRGKVFQSSVFDVVGFYFPPTVGEYSPLVSGQSGVASMGFAAAKNQAIKYSPDASGYWIFVNQTTTYINASSKDLFRVNVSTKDKNYRWSKAQSGYRYTAAGELTITSMTNGSVVLQQNVLFVVDGSTYNSFPGTTPIMTINL